jgi:hypothetical protein
MLITNTEMGLFPSKTNNKENTLILFIFKVKKVIDTCCTITTGIWQEEMNQTQDFTEQATCDYLKALFQFYYDIWFKRLLKIYLEVPEDKKSDPNCMSFSDFKVFALERFDYFLKWKKWNLNLIDQYKEKIPEKDLKKLFLADDTWCLMKVCLFGLLQAAEEYFVHFPDRYVCPKRLTQNTLELLFGIIKQGKKDVTWEKFKKAIAEEKMNLSSNKQQFYHTEIRGNYHKVFEH